MNRVIVKTSPQVLRCSVFDCHNNLTELVIKAIPITPLDQPPAQNAPFEVRVRCCGVNPLTDLAWEHNHVVLQGHYWEADV